MTYDMIYASVKAMIWLQCMCSGRGWYQFMVEVSYQWGHYFLTWYGYFEF